MREFLRSRGTVEQGHSLRVYEITAEGRQVLRQTRKALKELADEVLG
ncbi:MAG TPA: hypothetical protein VN522_12185 [Solirubrobacterales bacterium]|nr:hypothetical protein [Solirubrobacterales bacterium]